MWRYFFISLLWCQQALANPLSHVGSAIVKKGVKSFELRAGYLNDNESAANDDRFRTYQHVDVAYTDKYALRLIINQNQFHGDNLKRDRLTLQNRFHLIKAADYGWDAGIRLNYLHRMDDVDTAVFQLLGQGEFQPQWLWRHNILFSHDIGARAKKGVALELRSQLGFVTDYSNDLLSRLEIGAELFNNFGRLNDVMPFQQQQHFAGPVVKMTLPHATYAQLGYRVGLSKAAPDQQMLLLTGINF